MKRCQIVWKDEKNVKLSGVIDEGTDFAELVDNLVEELWIDFGGVTRINSCGVREWTRVMHSITNRIHFINCTSAIVDQLSMIPEFIGQNCIVDSFEAHYVCDECGHEETYILEVGKDIKPGLDEYEEGPERSCPQCKAIMEFDHNPEVYLDFLTDIDEDVEEAG